MLACDGIWDCLTNEECIEKLQGYISKYMGKGKPLGNTSKPVEDMLSDILAPDTAGDGTGTDNMTAILIL